MHASVENDGKNGQYGDVGGVKSKQSDNITTQLFIDLRTHFFSRVVLSDSVWGKQAISNAKKDVLVILYTSSHSSSHSSPD